MAHKINQNISLPDVKEAIIQNITEKQRELNANIEELNEKTEIKINNVDELLERTKENWLSDFIGNEKEKFLNAAFVPILTKRQIESDYQRVFNDVQPILSHIRAALRECPVKGLKQDSKGKFWFDSKEIEAYATEHCKITLPPKMMEYYEVFGRLYDAWAECRQWERTNNFVGLSSGYTAIPSALGLQFGCKPVKVEFSDLFANGKYLTMEKYADMVRTGIISQKVADIEKD